MIGEYEASIKAAAALSVTEADTLDDRVWFGRHPDSLFRVRAGNDGVWLIHRRRQSADPDVYLRTFSATQIPKSAADGELAVLWYAAACPDWPTERCRKSARKVSAQHCARDGSKGQP